MISTVSCFICTSEMTELYDAAEKGDLEQVIQLVERGVDKNQFGGDVGETALIKAAENDHLDIVRYLVEQGANRDKTDISGWTSLHRTAQYNKLELAKLLMVYGADLNARNNGGLLPIDMAANEEIKQAIRDEPRRRMDEAPGKRATEQDRHPNATASASAQEEDSEIGEDIEPSNKRPRLNEKAETEEGKVAEEDEDSEPSDEEDNEGLTS